MELRERSTVGVARLNTGSRSSALYVISDLEFVELVWFAPGASFEW